MRTFLLVILLLSGCVEIVNQNISQILPRREQIPIEFSTGRVKDRKVGDEGFVEGEASIGWATCGDKRTFLDFLVLKFQNNETALSAYNSRVSRVKSAPEIREIEIKDCFAWVEEYDIKLGISYCIEDNILFITQVTSEDSNEDVDGLLKEMTGVMKGNVFSKA